MIRISECIDLGWVAIFGPSLYVHLYSFCIIGMCQDLRANYMASFESALFVFTVCSLLAQWNLWPKSLKRPPNSLLHIYTALASIFITNMAFRLIFLPLLDLQAMINKELSTWLATISMCLGFGKKSRLYRWAEWLPTPPGLTVASRLWSILLFIWMLDATNKIGETWNYFERACKPIAAAVCTEINQTRGKGRRGSRRRQNFCEYMDDEFQSPTIIDPAEAPVSPMSQSNSIPWDEDTE